MALVTHEDSGYFDQDSEEDTKEVAFVTSETATSVIFDQSLLNAEIIRRAAKGIVLNGVDKSSPGIHVDLVGELRDIGTLYYCPTASANILSFAAMTDSGADIRYAAKHDRFTMKPRGRDMIYSFCRQDLPGSEGRFYICDTRCMIARTPTSHPRTEQVMVATAAENIRKYTKREVESAGAARELLARI
jgi:hypothetical protein